MVDLSLFESSVQKAVGQTLANNSPLFVFLTNNDDESAQFANKYLAGENLELVRARFVLLMLGAGTVEFGYFEQIFHDLPTPSFYIVQQGELLDVIKPDIALEDFTARIVAIQPQPQPQQPPAPPQQQPQSQPTQSAQPTLLAQPVEPQLPPTQASHPQVHTPPASASVRSVPQHPLQPTSHLESARKYRQEYAASKKQQEQERKRLRQKLDDDKRERAARQKQEQIELSNSHRKEDQAPLQRTLPDGCLLSIKLFDGSSVRQEFRAIQTLNDVRSWLDTEVKVLSEHSTMPTFSSSERPTHYLFHCPVIPRITYTDDQEFVSLQELKLCPRSALILKPVYNNNDFASSYPGGGAASGSMIRTFGTSLRKVGSALYSFFDYGVDGDHHIHDDEELGSESEDATATGHSSADQEHRHRSPILRSDTPALFEIDDNPNAPLLGDTTRNRSTASVPLLDVQDPVSRSSTPRLKSQSRIQTIHDEPKDDPEEAYNGNTVNLNRKEDDDSSLR